MFTTCDVLKSILMSTTLRCFIHQVSINRLDKPHNHALLRYLRHPVGLFTIEHKIRPLPLSSGCHNNVLFVPSVNKHNGLVTKNTISNSRSRGCRCKVNDSAIALLSISFINPIIPKRFGSFLRAKRGKIL